MGEQMYLTVCLLSGPGSIPGRGGIFRGVFPRPITLYQSILNQRGGKWLTPPQWGHVTQPADSEEESRTADRQ